MKGPSEKALNAVPFTDDFPPCATMRQLLAAEILFAGMGSPPPQSFRRPVTEVERSSVKAARKAQFVLVEKTGDGFARSYGSIKTTAKGAKR